MARHPSLKAVSFNDIAEKYHAMDFQDALVDFIARINHPRASATVMTPWTKFSFILIAPLPCTITQNHPEHSTMTHLLLIRLIL